MLGIKKIILCAATRNKCHKLASPRSVDIKICCLLRLQADTLCVQFRTSHFSMQ